jgi:hypothetical protein
MRKYEVAALIGDGPVRYSQHIAPATPVFEAAFSAFARGTLIATPDGPCAIEDMTPGMQVETRDSGPVPVLWIGSMTMVPGTSADAPELARLTRIMSDTFGLSRPMPDLVTGPGARLLHSPATLRELAIDTKVLTPVRAFVDGVSVIEITPPRPVALFHLCLPRHAVIRAAGLEVETFHPGPSLLRDMGLNMQALFLSLFPHLERASDFGRLAYPRAEPERVSGLSAA